MTKSVQKIALSSSRDIPFDKLQLSSSNVRHVKAGVSIEELADDIARRTLLTALTVRSMLDEVGTETGMYEIPAGGRRFRALELLVKQRRLAKTAPIPCVIRTAGLAEEDSLAENVQRAPLHPLDQFRAFLAMRERGMSEEEVAAAFFVTPGVVKQRLRLASVSPKLLDVYAADGMTLEQLMAFTVVSDHERQDAVWDAVSHGYTREPYAIRRMLTDGAVRATDKRAQYVGLENYVEAGGTVLRDLFQADDGGWLPDPALLELMLAEKLREDADAVRAEGWRWVEAAPEFVYGHSFGLRGIVGERVAPTDDETAAYEAMQAEAEQLEADHADDADLPEAVETRLGEIEAATEAYHRRPVRFSDEDRALAGAFVSIDGHGKLRVERGYVRADDEPEVDAEPIKEASVGSNRNGTGEAAPEAGSNVVPFVVPIEADEDEGLRPIPDRLLTELTAYRTVALREALGRDPHVAFTAALHVLCLKLFYHYTQDSCVEIDIKSASFGSSTPGLNDTPLAATIDARHQAYVAQMPRDPVDLWDTLDTFEAHERMQLFAHCVAQGLNAVYEGWSRRPRALAHADRLAQATALDMADSWQPTAANFLGRVTKARIVDAVREARGEQAAERIATLKKGDMAERAEQLLAGTGWLPEQLRTPGQTVVTQVAAHFDIGADQPVATNEPSSDDPAGGHPAANDGEPAMADDIIPSDDDEVAYATHAIAAE